MVDEIKAAGGEAIAVNGSVAEPGFADRFVKAATETFGGLDIIVNNAGYTWDSTIQKMTDEQFQAMLDVHLVAPFRILRAAAEPIRIMAKKEAEAGREVFRKVVNISSIAGLYGNAGQASYSAAKASLIGLTRTMCKEWGLQGQRQLRRLRPDQHPPHPADRGAAEDHRRGRPRHQGRRAAADARRMARMIPLGRGGTPEEAADAVYLFCSPESNYISGQVIVAGGGLHRLMRGLPCNTAHPG